MWGCHSIRRRQLVAAEEKARLGLAEGVAIGKITPAQEAAQLANLRTKLVMWVTKPLTD